MELEITFLIGIFGYVLGYLHKWWSVEHDERNRQ